MGWLEMILVGRLEVSAGAVAVLENVLGKCLGKSNPCHIDLQV